MYSEYNSYNQKTSLNLNFPLFLLSAGCSFFTDSIYPSDIFAEHMVGFLHPSENIWGVQNTEKFGSTHAVACSLLRILFFVPFYTKRGTPVT
jgi:hypothetical protein